MDVFSGEGSITGADDHDPLTALQHLIRQPEQLRLVGRIGQIVIRKLHRRIGDVMDLHPIMVFSVTLLQIAVVGGHDLGNNKRATDSLGISEGQSTGFSVFISGGSQIGFCVAAV